MSLIRLLQCKPNGEIAFREATSGDVPAYAILSHTWGKEEVIFQDIHVGADMSKTVSKAGWRKIQFCAKKAAADGLAYFWVDTCCIDKRNAVELGAAINSMFRWYQNAARCYVYLSDVSKPDSDPKEDGQRKWEEAFRYSRWFQRGWTLQELIAPRLVDFFSMEGEQLGSKLSLESQIHKITGIANKALRGDALSNFSIRERRSWAASRNTTIEEDEAYCLIGIFDVSMVPNYGERRAQAFRRLEEEIHKLYKGVDFEQFAVGLNLASFPEAVQFVAREKELSEMHELLQDHTSHSCVVLHGLGGIGKTQLAIKYAKRHKEKYTAIFWLNANDEETLKLSLRDLVQQVLKHHPSTSVLSSVNQDRDLNRVASAAKAWLDLPRNTRWLIIYDNFNCPKIPGNPDSSAFDIRQFLPCSDHGSIIITTRSPQVRQGRRIQVQKLLNVNEGIEILSNTSGRKGIEKDPNAIALVKELDGLPIALSTAGAYLEHVTTSFLDYLQLYKASWLKLQTTSPLLNSYKDHTLLSTWRVTFDQIQQQNKASAKLLKFWAYFDKQDLRFDILRHAKHFTKDEWIQKLTEDELNFNEAITLLCSYGMVELDQSGGYSLHSCVYSWTVFVLNKEWDKSLARLAVYCVASEVPSIDKKHWWFLQQRLLQHAKRQAHFMVGDQINIYGLHGAFEKLGNLYINQGKLAEAENMYIQALEGKEEVLGRDHRSTLYTVYNLGRLYIDQGKLAKAEKMYIRTLQGYEETFGPNHRETLDMVSNLGVLYNTQNRQAVAEKMYIRALQGKKKVLGLNHISTLRTTNDLGNVYADQGKLADAEKMYIQALKGFKEQLGLNHISTLSIVDNLGGLYLDQGKLSQAEKLYLQSLQGHEETLGPKHTLTLDAVKNLGSLYFKQGKLAEAEKMCIRALQGYEEALGTQAVLSHLPALKAMSIFGDVSSQIGRKARAKVMYARALSGFKTVQGPSSKRCKQTEDRLLALYATSAESKVGQDKITKPRAARSRSL